MMTATVACRVMSELIDFRPRKWWSRRKFQLYVNETLTTLSLARREEDKEEACEILFYKNAN